MKSIFTYFTNNYNQSLLAFDAVEIIQCDEGSNCLEEVSKFIDKHSEEYRFGFFSYDLKNEIEDLKSLNPDRIKFPKVGFFVPRYVVEWDEEGNQIFLKGEPDEIAEIFIS